MDVGRLREGELGYGGHACHLSGRGGRLRTERWWSGNDVERLRDSGGGMFKVTVRTEKVAATNTEHRRDLICRL